MKPLYPPLTPKDALPRRVVCIAPHCDDEILGCGGVLAFHARRGDQPFVVVLTDGSAGDPMSRTPDLVAQREAESRAAGDCLGPLRHHFLRLPDGDLSSVPDLKERLRALFAEQRPNLIYAPSAQEMHADHRAASRAALAAARAYDPHVRLHLFGVNAQAYASVLYDVSDTWEIKKAAVLRFGSQLQYHDLVSKVDAVDRARGVNIEDPAVRYVEGFVSLEAKDSLAYEHSVGGLIAAALGHKPDADWPEPERAESLATQCAAESEWAATAVISSWNKASDVLANLRAIAEQTLPFYDVVVVDNGSQDDTVARVKAEFPAVRLIVMPHSQYGACETFNIGFASVTTPLVAILDDDVVLPPDWLEKTTARLRAEPGSTAIISTKVVEPDMPESFKNSPGINRERYMSTFRGCGSLARTKALREAGFYDERLFIYGNERDLTCRLLNLGYRVLQYPGVTTFHKTPFGIKLGKRSLYFHARNAFLTMLKYAPLKDLARLPWLVLTQVILRRKSTEAEGAVTDATGTIGIGKSLRQTDGATWILFKACCSIIYNLPYCLARRQPVRAPDFELPLR